MRVTTVITVMFVLGWLTASARPFQQKTYPPNADGFNALLLNETTVDDALNILGPPDADEIGNLDVSKIGKWLDSKYKEKSFRQLSYKKSPDFFKIELSFLDQRLVMIDLEYKKNVRPQTMSKLFVVGFTELGGPIDLPDKPGQQPRGGFITTHWPNFYSMVGISAKNLSSSIVPHREEVTPPAEWSGHDKLVGSWKSNSLRFFAFGQCRTFTSITDEAQSASITTRRGSKFSRQPTTRAH